MSTKKVALIGISVSLAMVLSFFESLIPPLVAIPGIKIGLANIVSLFLLYKLGFFAALGVGVLRVLLSSLLFGNLQIFVFSLAGACLSLIGMAILKKISIFSCVAVSVAGGVLHNVGQIIVAALWTQTPQIAFYLPVLLVSGTVAGVVIGLLASLILKRLDKLNI